MLEEEKRRKKRKSIERNRNSIFYKALLSIRRHSDEVMQKQNFDHENNYFRRANLRNFSVYLCWFELSKIINITYRLFISLNSSNRKIYIRVNSKFDLDITKKLSFEALKYLTIKVSQKCLTEHSKKTTKLKVMLKKCRRFFVIIKVENQV